MINYSEFILIQEKLDIKRDYNNILKNMGVMNKTGKIDLINMTQKINDFLNSDDNKNKFLKDVESSEDIKGKKIKINVKKLNPGQTAIFLDQVVERILSDSKFTKKSIKGKVKDRDILISSDNYIIDGHHRCCSAFILNPDCDIKCTKINLPIEIAIPILNGILKATESESQSESGDDKYNIYELRNEKNIKDTLYEVIQEVGKELWNKRKREKKIEKFFNKVSEKSKKSPLSYLSKNIKKLPRPEDDLAEREDMPQLKDKVEKIID